MREKRKLLRTYLSLLKLEQGIIKMLHKSKDNVTSAVIQVI